MDKCLVGADCAYWGHSLIKGMCRKHYQRFRRSGSTARSAPVAPPPLGNHVVDSAGCWIWAGARFPSGYGKLSRTQNGTRLAHRFYYESLVGPIPAGLVLDHRCRVQPCVNPDHLEPVTQRTNMARFSWWSD